MRPLDRIVATSLAAGVAAALALVAMRQSLQLASLGDRPLIVVTAARDAVDGWMPLQAELTIVDVVTAVRTSQRSSDSARY